MNAASAAVVSAPPLSAERNRSSLAALTDTTSYHSFNDIELYEPPSPPRHHKTSTAVVASQQHDCQQYQHQHQHQQQQQQQNNAGQYGKDTHSRPHTAAKMQRQDSGYESYTSTPRTSSSHARPALIRSMSSQDGSGNSTKSSSRHRKQRPSTRRSAKTGGIYHHATAVSSSVTTPVYLVRTTDDASQHTSYFQFPSPDPIEITPTLSSETVHEKPQQQQQHYQQERTLPSPPPQTTHYWTSDDTRRLEYAAIDAASRGFKGWLKRNLVPDCLIPSEDRHVAFDDDTGSVRRYRLDLDEDEPSSSHQRCGGARKRSKGWHFWVSEGRKMSI